jgi:hypothetical protein
MIPATIAAGGEMTMRFGLRVAVLCLLLSGSLAIFLAARAAVAAPLSPGEVPEPLRPWTDWVLRGYESERCSLLTSLLASPGVSRGPGVGPRVCAWPTRLELALGERSGRFEQRWRVEQKLSVPLPGDARHWPQDVEVDGRPAPVGTEGQRPVVELEPGEHRVRGRFLWDALPELLQIPEQTALLSLSLEQGGASQPIRAPQRDEQGRLWLRKRTSDGDAEESRLEVVVHRRLADGIPLRLVTRLTLEVSGSSREVVLGRALPPSFLAMDLRSALPARLDPDGRLRLQVRPGRFELVLDARHQAGPALEILSAAPEGPWAESEIWVFAAQPELRLVSVSGGAPVDPQQTNLPPEWQNLPATLMRPGDVLTLSEKRRGDADPAPDLLSLRRSFWLDFDGGGYTIQDHLEGEIRRSSRLEMGEPTRLGRVALDGRDQFITELPGAPRDPQNPDAEDEAPEKDEADGAQDLIGIEVPRGAVEIVAESRIEQAGSRLPAVGWNHDVQALRGQLQLPPGWRLVHATGVDQARTTWVSRWNLLDIFTALIIALAFGRLFGWPWGVVAGVALLLSYTEPDAPRWAWLGVLIGEALARGLPSGRFASWISLYRGLALATLVLVALPFAVQQVRIGLHPALEFPGGGVAPVTVAQSDAFSEFAQEAPASPEAMAPKRRMDSLSSPALSPSVVYDAAGARERLSYEPDPAARITTGPGLPAWTWRSVELSWNGPVASDQELRFFLTPPWATGLIAFARVLGVAALAVCIVLLGSPGPGWIPRRRLWQPTAAAALVLTLVASLGTAGSARAELPSNELLEELRTRLLAPPDCAPACATSPKLRLEAQPDFLTLHVSLDLLAEAGVPLPGGARSWLPDSVRVDGREAAGLYATPDGVLFIQLPAGTHRVVMSGPLPDRDSIALPLPLAPHRVEAEATGWVLHGMLEDGRADRTLQLTRVARAGASETRERPLEAGELPAFVEVVRQLRLGITWQVDTWVRRLTPLSPSIRLELPLLPGEAVTSAGVRVRDQRVQVVLEPGVASTRWTSTLALAPELLLQAEPSSSWTEVWLLDTSPIWHVEATGIPSVYQPSATAARLRRWQPWPGESVRLAITRPAGVEGPTATVDGSALVATPGLRALDASLALSLRSSRGGEQRVSLPEGAVLRELSVDGRTQPIRQEGREVVLPLVPGSQQIALAWSQPDALSWHLRTPVVDLGMPSVNASIEIAVPQSRWILAVGGPRLGPAVLFWSVLVVLVLVSLGLGRIQGTPLRSHHWLLLGLGLTQVPVAAAVTVVAWLLALGWRRSRGNQVPGRWFDLVQVGLAALTVIALCVLLVSIRTGLLGLPEMQIEGNGSSGPLLRWYADRAGASLPSAWVVSVPLLVYRLAMLAWALWLAQALLRWLRWGWESFSHGELWRPLRVRREAGGGAKA